MSAARVQCYTTVRRTRISSSSNVSIANGPFTIKSWQVWYYEFSARVRRTRDTHQAFGWKWRCSEFSLLVLVVLILFLGFFIFGITVAHLTIEGFFRWTLKTKMKGTTAMFSHCWSYFPLVREGLPDASSFCKLNSKLGARRAESSTHVKWYRLQNRFNVSKVQGCVWKYCPRNSPLTFSITRTRQCDTMCFGVFCLRPRTCWTWRPAKSFQPPSGSTGRPVPPRCIFGWLFLAFCFGVSWWSMSWWWTGWLPVQKPVQNSS